MEKRFFILSLAFLLTLVVSVSAIRYYDAGRGYGSSAFDVFNLGNVNLLDFYNQYGSYVDMVLFLLIFLGLARWVFGQHFKEGNRTIYVGLGLFLSFALLLYEESANFHILTAFGPIVLVLFLLIVIFLVSRFLLSTGRAGIFVIGVTYLVLYYFLTNWYEDYWANVSGFSNVIAQVANIFLILAWIIVIVGVVYGLYLMISGQNRRTNNPWGEKMKFIMTLIGIVIILVGLLPILEQNNLFKIAFMPTSGTAYNVIIILLGVITTWYGFKHKEQFTKWKKQV